MVIGDEGRRLRRFVIRYAISNWIYGDEPLREQFARLARFGYEGIELVGEPDRYAVKDLKNLCKEFGIMISSVLGWSIHGIPGRDGASPKEEERKSALQYCQNCVNLASELEAPILVVIPAPAGRTAPTGAPNSQDDWFAGYRLEWNLAVDSLGRLSSFATQQGVVLGLEPINRYETFLVNNIDQALRMIKEVGSDQLKLHLDTFHMNIDESDLPGAIRRAAGILVNMHISDSNREAPGRGHIDFHSLVGALKEICYTGYLTLEPVPPGSDPLLMTQLPKNYDLRDIYAQESITYLQKVEASI